MSEMIERVALAISGSDDPANILGIHRGRARLAIEAMREPTSEMCDAAEWHQQSDVNRYHRAIDAALAKQEQ